MHSYTFHITLYDVAFIGMTFIGLTFALQLWFTKSINRAANRPLALALVIMVLWMSRVLAIDIQLETYLPHWDRLPMEFLFALGPFIYYYVLKITRPDYKFRWTDLWHFSPLLLEQAVQLVEIRESLKTGAATYATSAFHLLNPVLQLLLFISIQTYLYHCHQVIQKFYRRLSPVLMDRSLLEFRWLRRLLATSALLWCLWLAYAAVDEFGYHNQSGVHVYYPFYISFAIITIWVAAATFLQPQAGIMAQKSYTAMPRVPTELRTKGVWLKKVMETNRYHQDGELSLYALAERLNLSPHELSRIINTALKKSFSDFINEYRVRDVIAKMQDSAYDHITLQGIAYDSGFNSPRTFHRAFKETTGKTPAEYKKELPSYNLAHSSRFAAITSNPETTPQWSSSKLSSDFMFKNYLKIAWRNVIRNKTSAAINISGLAVGLASSILILLWVQNESGYDKFHQNAGQIYRVVSNLGDIKAAVSPAGMAAGLKAEMPVIRNTVRMMAVPTVLLESGNKKLEEKRGFYADPAFMDIFSFPLAQGDRAKALSQPNGILITREMAKKYFGDENAIGKALRKDNSENVVVTGVFADIPSDSQLQFDFILPMAGTNATFRNDAWDNFNFYTYVQLDRSFEPSAARLSGLEKQIGELFHQRRPGMTASFELQPLTGIHLALERLGDLPGHGNKAYVRTFFIIAILILFVACINFMNLATARSARRAKEIGLRKVAGARRTQLILQFLSESIFISFLSLVIALGIVWLVLPAFNELAGKKLGIDLTDLNFWIILLVIAVLTGLVSGSYPALFLSGFNPVKVLKGNIKSMGGNPLFRNALVVTQFIVSIVLLAGTVIIYQQLRFMKDRDPGFEKANLLYMPMSGDLASKQQVLKDELKTNPLTSDCAFVSDLPANLPNASSADWVGKDPRLQAVIPEMRVNEDFISVFGMKMLAGRSFSGAFAADSNHYMINEKMARLMGLTAGKAIGKTLTLHGNTGTIVGVVKDFNFKPVQQAIEPLVLRFNKSGGFVVVRTAPGKTRETITALDQINRILNPAYPFKFNFLDQNIANLYKSQQQMGSIFGLFALLGIFISCLGLYGLSAFMAEQRIKEIGVRKVLGASVINLVYLLSSNITRLILIAIGIAVPLSWYAADKWLSGFAYHIEPGWLVFFTAALMSMGIAWITVSYESVKAARVNPAKSLRTE